MNLSQHFTLKEMCVTKSVLPNIPDAEEIQALIHLCHEVLEPVRAHFGGRPLKVNSAFRSPEINRLVGGSPTSQHLFGQAADIEIPGVANADIWSYIVNNLKFDQVIAEYLRRDDPAAGWVHVSFRIDRARYSAISCIGKGKYPGGLHYVA